MNFKKKINRGDIELLSPAGSFESLMAAIQGGADAVYFGAGELNMRIRSANNFSLDDLAEVAEICRKNSIKSYLTVNTVVYDGETAMMREIVREAKKSGISAIIATDHSVISFAHSIGMEVHISTQVNISNIESVKFYSKYADVMVLARELTLEQTGAICRAVQKEQIKGPSGKNVAIEIFIHGALCMAVSGKCYLSLHEKNLSANRGSCIQTCRKSYLVREKESGYELVIDGEYIMSPKDLCTIHFLNKIIDSGATVLKIEGRARSPEYVKIVTQCYNEALESIAAGTYSADKIDNWKKRLSTVFNRGFWDGYYLGQKMGEWSHKYGSDAAMKKVYVGKGTNYYSKINVAEFIIENGTLSVGDQILIIGPTTGVIETTVKELRTGNGPVYEAVKGEACSIYIDRIVRRSDKLYKFVRKTGYENPG